MGFDEEGGITTTSSSYESSARLAIVPRSSRAPTSSSSSSRLDDETFDRESRTSHWRGCDPLEDDVDECDADDEDGCDLVVGDESSRFDSSVIDVVLLDGRRCDEAAVAHASSTARAVAH